MSSNTAPTDQDVADILNKLKATDSPPVWPSEPAAQSAEEFAAEFAAEEDERPIVVNLPAREDPTKTLVAEGIPSVQPVGPGGQLLDDPALKNVTEWNVHNVAAMSAPVGSNPAAAQLQPTSSPTQAPAAPVEISTSDPSHLPEDVRAVLAEYGCHAWLIEGEKPYWQIRQGPRSGAVPLGASAAEWAGRCNGISVRVS